MKIASLQNQQSASRLNFISSTWANIVESVYKTENLYDVLLADDGAMKLLNATGIALTKNGKHRFAGSIPRDGALDELMLWLHTRTLRNIYATDSLQREYEYAKDFDGDAAGMLVIPINNIKDHYLIVFRHEKVKLINWGGNPEERIQFENEKNYHPRNSFNQWQQKVSGVSQPWRDEELKAAETLRSFIYEYETSPIIR